MNITIRISFAIIMILSACAWGASSQINPHIGYVYPAGGRQGSCFSVTVGGQYLKDVQGIQFSRQGIRGELIEYIRPLNRKQLSELRLRLREISKKRMGLKNRKPPASENIVRVKLPDHPLLRNLEEKNQEELEKIRGIFFNPKKQENRQLEETVQFKITIDPDAEPGDMEIRLVTRNKLSNSLRFQVGTLKELYETEPNDLKDETAAPQELPFLLNGQIMPGDVDRFRFRAKKGRQIVLEVQARKLMPYLADAVPGWFQPVLALYNDKGEEIAYADDYYIDPDPKLFFEIPQDGSYELEIRDAVYRGREDFVYRICVKTQSQFAGKKTTTDFNENEPNDLLKKAPKITLPHIIRGVISHPEDRDIFTFNGKQEEEIVAEIHARRMNSPLDSLLRLTDDSGKIIEWNDDFPVKNTGLITHHADSCIRVRLPRNGLYSVQVTDAQKHGDENYIYKLYVGPPRPGFSLYMTPSSVSIAPGRSIPITVYAIRKHGFTGEIRLALDQPSAGFQLNGGLIPEGCDSIRITLTAPPMGSEKPVTLQMSGMALIAGKERKESVVASEDMMQAFLYRHLVPSENFHVMFTRTGRSGLPIKLEGKSVLIPEGGSAMVRMRIPPRAQFRKISLKLNEPPDGVSLKDVDFSPGLLCFRLLADSNAPKAGFSNNLIIEAFMERTQSLPKAIPGKKTNAKPENNKDKSQEKKKSEKDVKQNKHFSIGFLPAIPFKVVEP